MQTELATGQSLMQRLTIVADYKADTVHNTKRVNGWFTDMWKTFAHYLATFFSNIKLFVFWRKIVFTEDFLLIIQGYKIKYQIGN